MLAFRLFSDEQNNIAHVFGCQACQQHTLPTMPPEPTITIFMRYLLPKLCLPASCQEARLVSI
ncbi:hypothetical protein DMH17_03305 [Raoultella planticola]|nr:hypothetical protein [Raoultella planticola]